MGHTRASAALGTQFWTRLGGQLEMKGQVCTKCEDFYSEPECAKCRTKAAPEYATLPTEARLDAALVDALETCFLDMQSLILDLNCAPPAEESKDEA